MTHKLNPTAFEVAHKTYLDDGAGYVAVKLANAIEAYLDALPPVAFLRHRKATGLPVIGQPGQTEDEVWTGSYPAYDLRRSVYDPEYNAEREAAEDALKWDLNTATGPEDKLYVIYKLRPAEPGCTLYYDGVRIGEVHKDVDTAKIKAQQHSDLWRKSCDMPVSLASKPELQTFNVGDRVRGKVGGAVGTVRAVFVFTGPQGYIPKAEVEWDGDNKPNIIRFDRIEAYIESKPFDLVSTEARKAYAEKWYRIGASDITENFERTWEYQKTFAK